MTNTQLTDLDERSRRLHSSQCDLPMVHNAPVQGEHAAILPTAISLLRSSRSGSGANAPARTALMTRAQQTHGNRAVQRCLQRDAPLDEPAKTGNAVQRFNFTRGMSSGGDMQYDWTRIAAPGFHFNGGESSSDVVMNQGRGLSPEEGASEIVVRPQDQPDMHVLPQIERASNFLPGQDVGAGGMESVTNPNDTGGFHFLPAVQSNIRDFLSPNRPSEGALNYLPAVQDLLAGI